MRRILILRHAEAAPGDDDFNRALTTFGRKSMRAMAAAMTEGGYTPDHIFCSPAARTRETRELACPDAHGITSYPDIMYNAAVDTLFGIVQDADDAHGTIMIIAHNPGIHGLARMLAADTSGLAGYNPGTLTVLEYAGAHWRDIQPGASKVRDIYTV